MIRANPNHAVNAARLRAALTKGNQTMTQLTATAIERDVARDFAGTLRACRAFARQGRAQAQAMRVLTACTREFARAHRMRVDGVAAIDRIHNLAQRAIALGVAPTSVTRWHSARVDRALNLGASAHD